ncbi:MAG: AAA family ATPase, partial [Lachnospiraceae bacterium]|nr:AAA family ATPase [Lachnospiraceae bacterium]
EEQNLADRINSTEDELIKKLSGKGSESGVKLIDNVISFVSLAGGCGASFLVSNLAYIMTTKYNLQVLVIDMNIAYPIQYTYFNGEIAREKADLVSFLLGRNEIGESIVTKKNTSILYSSERYLMDLINCDSEKTSQNLSSLIDNIKYLFDVILIDCPNSLEHDVVNMAMFKSDSIYTVWNESLSCIANANRFRSNLNTTGIDSSKLRAILNKRTSIQYASSVFDDLGYELVSIIPFDKSVIECDLMAQIYMQKCDSFSKNAGEIVSRLEELALNVLTTGGYKDDKERRKVTKQLDKQNNKSDEKKNKGTTERVIKKRKAKEPQAEKKEDFKGAILEPEEIEGLVGDNSVLGDEKSLLDDIANLQNLADEFDSDSETDTSVDGEVGISVDLNKTSKSENEDNSSSESESLLEETQFPDENFKVQDVKTVRKNSDLNF